MPEATVVDLATGEIMDAYEAEVLNAPAIPRDQLDDAIAELNDSLGSPEPDHEALT